jgi:putative transcriptional regulator
VTWLTPLTLLIVLATFVETGRAARPAEPLAPPGDSAPAPAKPSPPTPRSSTIGQMLVATESLRDPRFAETVVYMLRHDATGALGLIINRPIATVPLARLLESLGRSHDGATGDIRVHYGGPVEPGRGFVLHTAEWMTEDSRLVHADIAVTTDPTVFEALAHGGGPRRALFAAGYAGWAPGQLEAEIDGGFWIVVSADESLIFDDDAGTKWERATQRRRLTL